MKQETNFSDAATYEKYSHIQDKGLLPYLGTRYLESLLLTAHLASIFFYIRQSRFEGYYHQDAQQPLLKLQQTQTHYPKEQGKKSVDSRL
nr:hypothetical protein [Marinobacter nauticus]